jgi:hypothetical protein
MKTPTRIECMVCYEEKFISPCGSQSDCNVYICRECKLNTKTSTYYYMTDTCYICKQPEWKDGLIPDLDDVVDGTSGMDYSDLNKVLKTLRTNHGIGYDTDEE